jgi:hypothetical protein
MCECMRAIWKYRIPVRDNFTLELPVGARLLTAQVQNGEPCLWVLTAPRAETVKRYFCLFGTGHPMESPGDLTYVGTFQQSGGAFVWHLFERQQAPREGTE